MKTVLLVLVLWLGGSIGSDYETLLELDRSISGNRNRRQFPVLPPPRTTRQTAGTDFICVPTGTCITAGGGGTNIIDPRIVTPGQTVAPPVTTPTNCPAGQVACFGLVGGASCGQRYVTGVTDVDGTATYGAFPWQAYVQNLTGYTGSGVLVDSLHIITAAHKVNLNVATPQNVRVSMGVHNPATTLANAQMRSAAQIVLHPNFNPTTLINDIAVVRLNSPISLGYQINIATACLPAAGTSANYVNQRCWVSGWGRSAFTTNDAPTTTQKQVRVPIVSYATCRASMAQTNVLGTNVDTYLDPNGELCAGGEANKDACTQDGGSPLVCLDTATNRYTVAGLVIWGKNCGQPNVYGVYVDVPKYRAWIDQTINSLNAG